MNIHCLQHVPHEGLGSIDEWIRARNHTITKTLLFDNTTFPDVDKIDLLVVMGGPMSVNDEHFLPWLKEEKRFIKQTIDAEKIVVGFCLGAQLIANVLGGRVYKNEHKEIGWADLRITDAGLSSKAFAGFPKQLSVFQWHGETFEIPQLSRLAATNDACRNQALIYNDRVVGLQFHLEVGEADVTAWIENGADELTEGKYVQTKEQMLGDTGKFTDMRKWLFGLMDNMAG